MLDKIFLNKKEGETPLEAMERYRKEFPEYSKVKMCYAGRLDPLAEGLLLILVGEECKNRDKYLNSDKEYVFEVLFGFSTDTYDILGLVKDHFKSSIDPSILKKQIIASMPDFQGKSLQEYPAYSSKTELYEGKKQPLFVLARRGQLADVEISKKEIEVFDIDLVGDYIISAKELKQSIHDRISLVTGDFRQKEILARWDEVFKQTKQTEFPVVKIKINCSSGTYVRNIASQLGQGAGIPSLAFKIKRTNIGSWIAASVVVPPLSSQRRE
jgi:tRNA pseudouridine(55) synthase